MTGHGSLAAHHRDGDHVIKMLDGRHPAGARFVTAAQAAGRAGTDDHITARQQHPQPETVVSNGLRGNPR